MVAVCSEGYELYLEILCVPLRITTDTLDVLNPIAERYSTYVCKPHTNPIEISFRTARKGIWIQFEGRRMNLVDLSRWPRPDDILTLVVERERADLCFFHASSVVYDGKAALFVGASTCGKTTLCLALQQRGYVVLAEDTTPVDLCSGRAFPLRTAMGCRENTTLIGTQAGWRFDYIESATSYDCQGVPIGWVFFLKPAGTLGSKTVLMEGPLKTWQKLLALCYGETAPAPANRTLALTVRGKQAFENEPALEPCQSSLALRNLIQHCRAKKKRTDELIAGIANLDKSARFFSLVPGYLESTLGIVSDCLRNR